VQSLLPFVLLVLLGLGSPAAARAQGTTENAEARTYFDEGNRLYQEASGARGTQRTQLLQRALGAYVDSLQIVRSRNALFNAAIVLEELERYDEAFNYFGEYLRVEDVPEADRDDATRRRESLRGRVAVLQVQTEPAGALVWVDRKDLAARGETPMELALPPGTHRLFIEKPEYEPVELSQALVLGESASVELSLEPEPAPLPTPVATPTPMPPEPEKRLRLRNAAIGTAASALATAAVGLGVSLRARTLRNEYDSAAEQYQMSGDPADYQRAQDLANRTDRFNLTADVFWGATIALGVSSIVLYGMHRKRQKREVPKLGVLLSRHGGFASYRFSFGARP
jgi:tetratricopeptide (TPR) repeat protein